MSDNDDPLGDEPFSFRASKDGKVMMFHQGRVVVTLKGKEAERFLRKAERSSAQEVQMLLAKATGNFKRGNERMGK